MGATAGAFGLGDPAHLARQQTAIDRLLMAEGAGHVVHDLPARADGRNVTLASRPWRLDPIPYVVSADEFVWLEEAVARRMRMLEAILDDLYGERSLVADGQIDPAMLWGSTDYRLAAVGAAERRNQKRWLSTYAVDVVRRADGAWFAIADLVDTSVGVGYMLLDRRVHEQVADVPAEPVRSLEPSLHWLRKALIDTTDVVGPRVVMLTSGIDHPAYVEHAYMATQLGFNVVEGPDLVVRDHCLWLQTLGGLERVDVLHRQIADRQLDPLETNTYGSAGIPAVLLADEKSALAITNAHGSGVLQDPSLLGSWDRVGEALTGEAPWLTMNSPRVARGSTRVDDLLEAPAERVPCLVDGQLVDHPIVIRFHAVASDDGITVMPGGNGRVIEAHDDPIRPTPCRAKDVWVLGDEPVSARPAAVSAPQVDFITSVPTRAADSLYWMGRASERSEVVARAARVVAAATPSVGASAATPAMRLLRELIGAGPDWLDGWASAGDLRREAVVAGVASLEFHIGSMLAEAASVREFLSTTTGRVLGELATTRSRLSDHPGDVDELDSLLVELSAFGGLWSESVVRGPAWYFGDFAKRYERTVVSLTSAAAASATNADASLSDPDRRRGLESVLAANDSLVAYRRRHRSDVELDAVLRLLLHDDRNPRSAAASVAGLVRNATAIGWNAGIERIESVGDDIAAIGPQSPKGDFDDIIERLHTLAAELTSTRLVAPPHATPVRPRTVDPGAVA
ncbi:circularly permuted type 2 ATP-grasp protein [Ilumatobacter coccineus]|uniref:Uncharacterized protein n=1 Tax=Ilumatobacter coccineus (strain NBRC 103263 / KCTC 29153 / YM16-304) TaxID=1313172 RepID=A0A6C7EA44_ILUCY|nr:circularly permuted type 2 ATP-grasp protein [Ilumatobacter coccineus]BAN03203.1 hypothetical protein YM304_28890 [Ilumatobacter coccineus YM16-304]